MGKHIDRTIIGEWDFPFVYTSVDTLELCQTSVSFCFFAVHLFVLCPCGTTKCVEIAFFLPPEHRGTVCGKWHCEPL